MSKNYMAEVAKLLGAELGESFKITSDTQGDYPGDYQNYYRFTENNCFETSVDGVKWETATVIVLRGILMGDTRIVKLPWKPRKGEMYYFPDMGTSSLGSCLCWLGTETDKNLYDRGFVFQTIEEAIATAKRILAIVQEGKNNG